MTKKDKIIQVLYKYLLFFLLGGAVYFVIELLWRGYSHYTMFMLGGLCFILIGLINEYFPWDMYIEIQTLIGTLVVLILEFVCGCIINLWWGWHIWDYSNMPLNVLGQICLPFALIWIPIVLFAIWFDDRVRHDAFGEEKPRYRSFIAEKIKAFKKK